MNNIIATIHRAVQADVDRYIRTGSRPHGLATRRVEREICYADHLKAIVDQVDRQRSQADEQIA